ncbi:MAG: hypothetical protein ABIW38_06945, partial [Ferruginibacter sp.]
NTVSIYFNPTSPSLTGASYRNSASALFAAPHAYNIYLGNNNIAAGASGYFIITVDVDAAATLGNTVKVDGLANPVTFTYTTSPPVTNNQTDITGTQTISSVVPLKLISFTGNLINTKEVNLRWITGEEINTKTFDVEWSDNGQHFNKIATINAAGSSIQNLNYLFIHRQPVEGNNYYRLKMIDIDGQFTYSPVITINIIFNIAKITALPNHVVDYLQLSIDAPEIEKITIRIYNAIGTFITSKSIALKKGCNFLSWDIHNFNKGYYFIVPGNNHFKPIEIFKN